MKNIKKEVIVGLFATASLVMLYMGYYYLKGIDLFSKTSKYYAVYENIDQLAVSNPVFINGYNVGRVSHIRILQDMQNRIEVELSIDSEVKLGDSTKAILTSELLSGKYILLSIGPVKEPLKPGSVIKAEVAKGLMDVFTESSKPVADNLQTTLRNFNMVIDNLSHNSQQLDTILHNFQGTPYLLNRTLSTAGGRIDELAVSFKAVSENLNTTLLELKPTISNFKVLSDSLKQMHLNQTINQAQKTLISINDTMKQLKKGDNTASKLLTEDSLYVNLNKLLVHLDTLVKHFDNNPKHFLGPLGQSQKKIERDRKKQEADRLKAAQKK